MSFPKGIIDVVDNVRNTTISTPSSSSKNKSIIKNETKNINSQCQVIVFLWNQEVINRRDEKNDQLAAQAEAFDISNHIYNCTFTKNMESPAGNFSMTIDATRDWKDILKPGQWCIILMSNEGNLELPDTEDFGRVLPKASLNPGNRDKIRAIGYIERVAVNTSMTDTGAFDISYEVSGRDFGVIYEETEIWYNFFKFEKTKLESFFASLQEFNVITPVGQLVKKVHDLFYAPHKVVSGITPESQGLAEIGTQWLMPKPLLNMLKVPHTNSSYYGQITNLFDDGFENGDFAQTAIVRQIENPLLFASGAAWEKLKEISVQELHELYTELNSEGQPRLVFRPIPWAIRTDGYPALAPGITKYKDLGANKVSSIPIHAIDVLDFNLGEDNHARYNHFLLQLHPSVMFPLSNVSVLFKQKSLLGREFPYIQRGSIKRHGLRLKHVSINTLAFSIKNLRQNAKDLKDGLPFAPALLQFNELLTDYWNNAIFFESGTMSIVGNPKIRLGKALNCQYDIPYVANKLFYIEGYTDEFTVQENGSTLWTQTLQLTRGIEKADLKGVGSGFRIRSEEGKASVVASDLTIDSGRHK